MYIHTRFYTARLHLPDEASLVTETTSSSHTDGDALDMDAVDEALLGARDTNTGRLSRVFWHLCDFLIVFAPPAAACQRLMAPNDVGRSRGIISTLYGCMLQSVHSNCRGVMLV